jgi:hypothetical protein
LRTGCKELIYSAYVNDLIPNYVVEKWEVVVIIVRGFCKGFKCIFEMALAK